MLQMPNNAQIDLSKVQTAVYNPNDNPYLDSRLRGDRGANLTSFMDDLIRMWKMAGKEGVIRRDTPMSDDIALPSIGFKTVSRVIDPHFKDMKPRYRQTILHPYVIGEYVEIRGQMFEVIVEFRVYANTSEQADELADEFEEFIQIYKGLFKWNGVQDVMFHQQLPDENNSLARFNVAVRPIQYKFRFEKISLVFMNQIEQMAIQYQNLVSNKQDIEEEDQNGNG